MCFPRVEIPEKDNESKVSESSTLRLRFVRCPLVQWLRARQGSRNDSTIRQWINEMALKSGRKERKLRSPVLHPPNLDYFWSTPTDPAVAKHGSGGGGGGEREQKAKINIKIV